MAATLTRKEHGPEVLAKRRGTCKRCGEAIDPGAADVVAKVDGLGWCHALCAKQYCETVNAHLEDDRDQVQAVEEERRVRARRIHGHLAQLRELGVPDDSLQSVEGFARELVGLGPRP